MITPEELHFYFTDNDILRLNSYSRNLVDYHMIMDIVPALARLFFMRRFGDLSLSPLQEALLIGQGLQHKTIDDLLVEFPKVDGSQLLALFNRSIRKIQKFLEVSVVWIVDKE